MAGLSPVGASAGAGVNSVGAAWLVEKVGRYMLAAVGPVGVAATHFILSLVLLQLLEPSAFGILSFLLVATQLSWGIWSALLCAPLPVFLAHGTPEQRAAGEATLLSLNQFGAIAAVLVFLGLALALALPAPSALCFAMFGGLALLRWFGRAYAYVHGRQVRAMASDLAYSGTVLAALALMILGLDMEAQFAAYAALLAGAAAGLVTFGGPYLGRFGRWQPGLLREYAPIWRGQCRWALLGVTTTEATANTHVYVVTLLSGAAAFAPIAASALLLRPVNVAQNALSDFERPQIARQISAGEFQTIPRSLSAFRMALAGIWLGAVLIGAALFLFAPRLLFPLAYDLHFLIVASLLWAVVAALRLLQTPESALLQAAGEFKDLAMGSVWSSIGSVVGVLVLVIFAGTLWSIVGLILGSAIYLFWTHRFTRRWWTRQPGLATA